MGNSFRAVQGFTGVKRAQSLFRAVGYERLNGPHGFVRCALAVAGAAVFAKRLPRRLRLASRLEGRLSLFRQLQIGHPGDNLVWAMVGFVFVGGCLYLLS
ncbi:MAG: hypothetical protein ACRD25_00085 [Terracidiphilus sp.]